MAEPMLISPSNRLGGAGQVESNHRYFARRATEELRAAARAMTPEGQARRRALAEAFATKARQCIGAEEECAVHA